MYGQVVTKAVEAIVRRSCSNAFNFIQKQWKCVNVCLGRASGTKNDYSNKDCGMKFCKSCACLHSRFMRSKTNKTWEFEWKKFLRNRIYFRVVNTIRTHNLCHKLLCMLIYKLIYFTLRACSHVNFFNSIKEFEWFSIDDRILFSHEISWDRNEKKTLVSVVFNVFSPAIGCFVRWSFIKEAFNILISHTGLYITAQKIIHNLESIKCQIQTI